MLRLLIVDDEPYVVDDLYEFFSNNGHLALEVYRAYSGNDALALLNKAKFDIVLSDIRMPDIGGLDIAGEVSRKWPKCRVIFLTGHSEFEMAYGAIRNNVVSYILKTEDDAEILRAVGKAAEDILRESGNELMIEHAMEQMRLAIPLLQQEYILDLLLGEKIAIEDMTESFAKLEIGLDPAMPVYILLGRVDCWPENTSPSNRAQLLYTFRNIAAKYLTCDTDGISAIFARTKLVWLVQSGKKIPDERMHVVLKNALESIQMKCSELLSLSVSFVLCKGPVGWDELNIKFDELKYILNQGLGFGKEMLLTDNVFSGPEGRPSNEGNFDRIRTKLKRLDFLEIYLEYGQKNELKALLLEIIAMAGETGSCDFNAATEIYYSISLAFLAHINKMGISKELAPRIDLNRLMQIEEVKLWDEAAEYFVQLVDLIFENRKNSQDKRANDIVNCINQYINSNPDGNLSLIELADLVYLNPSYLSRFYRHVTGKTITDYINETRLNRAKELLAGSDMKIYKIAAAVGYKSAPYFTRSFKKELKMTPQDFRDLHSR